ncbi:uridine kinase family protein [Nocardioides acrostichi]|uniref:4-amino-4-deoxy-L-arabinose transferase n=1 Tax=Nocardioides acrostichi TaxID=2784339 RepID=A0A930YC22_9ACTN|nr:4-amino-4-deoxy-L-arabinose transferase [Nocardioides acrostichi]MBF4163058.1 4-amino-4-deoxy-L-arabinose transferase [Nocardioides acrostichi]
MLDLARRRPPTLDTGRLVCVDGPSGSGKTTLARALAASSPDALVVHMDDLYEGWEGLAGVAAQLSTLLEPLAAGRSGRYRRYDWLVGDWAEDVTVPPSPLVVLEGVGAGSAPWRHLHTVLVWMQAPAPLRRVRGIARDGEVFAARWGDWARREEAHFATNGTRTHADLVLDTDHEEG